MPGSSPASLELSRELRGAQHAQTEHAGPAIRSLYRAVLVAADCSDHANRAVSEAVALARLAEATVAGMHVYAARLHDLRFRQMEGGLPEQYRQEKALEESRAVHDGLITRGLSLIADAYLDQAEQACRAAAIPFTPLSAEGKNYRVLLDEANSGRHDLLVIGAQGLGAVAEGGLGTVCERVVRRAAVDTLVIKDPRRRLADGPIVAAVDGSDRAYGGLLSALALAQAWSVPLHVVAAYDPYFHYVAFDRISRVLSEEAGRTFRFADQERLHEEIIDAGLAKIYRGHLSVAQSIAAAHGVAIETALLDGKAHAAIERYLRELGPTLLVIGKLGIHADPALDIGGNAERLLRNAGCAVLLSQRVHRPPGDTIAAVTTTWTAEAERRLERVPEFARRMARMAILQFAQERGHTVITERIVEDATAMLCPGRARTGGGPLAGHGSAATHE